VGGRGAIRTGSDPPVCLVTRPHAFSPIVIENGHGCRSGVSAPIRAKCTAAHISCGSALINVRG